MAAHLEHTIRCHEGALRSILIAALLLALVAPAAAQCPPGSYPVGWPLDSSWMEVQSLETTISDQPAASDTTTGGPVSPAYVDFTDGTSGTQPSLYWYFSNELIFYRLRLAADPRVSPFPPDFLHSRIWAVTIDTDGDGFGDWLIQLNGINEFIEVLYNNPAGGPDHIYNPTPCSGGGDTVALFSTGLLPFRVIPSADGGFFLDMQVPICFLSDCSQQVVTNTTPLLMSFTTSDATGLPTRADLGSGGAFSMASNLPLPGSDPCQLLTGCTQDPVIVDVTIDFGDCTEYVQLDAFVLDTLVPNGAGTAVIDTIDTVVYEYKKIGTAAWLPIATLTEPSPSTLNQWIFEWDTSTLEVTDYWVRTTVTDDQSNVTTNMFNIDLADCSRQPVPVSLAWLRATNSGSGTRVEWDTATEAGNLGFNLYGKTSQGWTRINDKLIASHTVDSVEPQRYRFDADSHYEAVAIEDVDVRGRTTEHGPVAVGREIGRRPAPSPIDWYEVRTGLAQADGLAPESLPSAMRLLVDRDGLYRVGYEALAAAGLDLAGTPADDIAVTVDGAPVHILVASTGASPGRVFGPGWYVELWATALENLYTSSNVYRLVVDPSIARRVRSSSQQPEKPPAQPQHYLHPKRIERNRNYSFSAPNGDPWYDERMLTYSTPTSWSFEIEVDELAVNAKSATLEVDMWGWTNFQQIPDHHVEILLNGRLVADEEFDGLVAHSVTIELPIDLVQEGSNELEIRLPGDTGAPYDLVALESFELRYPRWLQAIDGRLRFSSREQTIAVDGLTGDVVAYRLENRRPVRLATWRDGDRLLLEGTGRRDEYVLASVDALLVPELEPAPAPADLTSGRADYLIIAHPLFLDGVGELAAAREQQGHQVRVVNVEDVYEQFDHGRFGSRALVRYLRAAHDLMGVRAVLLVGADTYDYHDDLGIGSVSFVPSLYAQTHPVVSFAPVDPAYGDIDGDNIPDIAIGRFPVRTVDELDAMVAKTLAYDSVPYARHAVFAADRPDGGTSFKTMSDDLVEALGRDWTVDRAYIEELGLDGARSVLVDGIDDGAALTAYVGHSGLTMWSFETLFDTDHALALSNHGRPTVVAQWGCWNTYHVSPTLTTLGEALTTSGTQGAAAALGATSLIEVYSADALSRELVPQLAAPGTTLGEALLNAKREVAADYPNAVDVLLGWTLLGDPALVVTPR